jgi:hypothetical protein
VIGGGDANVINSNSWNSAIVGGQQNVIGTNSDHAFIGGGNGNLIQPNSPNATIPGGTGNKAAGNSSFAAGSSANASTANSFVWSDGSATTSSTAAKQFMVRASGGVIIYSGSGTGSGVSLPAGGGAWNNLSDRNAKEKFTPVTSREVLAKLAVLPITKWSYKTEPGVTHIGPMAQDFYSAFGVGEDERHISTVDEEGVALAAIQGLNQKIETGRQNSEVRIQKLEAENSDLKARLEKLELFMNHNNGGVK